MTEAGAGILDVGGESTRPGAAPVSPAEEADRVLPVIEGIQRHLAVRVSVDTMKAEVARQALDAGASLVNDVTALSDPAMLPLLVERGAPVVLMHMRGTPRTMQRDTSYGNLIGELCEFLRLRAESAVAAGLSGDKIMIDPGIGFGKSVEGNLTILRRLPELARLGKPILIGASRKSFIGAVLDLPVQDRLEGGLAVAAFASAQGAHVVRAHDVDATVRVVRMIDAIRGA
jgi:dihydropteroate synthase